MHNKTCAYFKGLVVVYLIPMSFLMFLSDKTNKQSSQVLND